MKHATYIFIAFAALAIIGCAPPPPQAAPGIDTPASSQAPESPAPRLETLTLASPAGSQEGKTIKPQQMRPDMQHDAHQHGGQP